MKVRSIKYNAILNIIYNISNIIFPLVTFPYVSRILLADGTGKVSFFSSVGCYATMFASLGISTYGIRATAKVRDNKKELSKVVQELLIINTFASMIVLATLIFSVFYVDKFRQEPMLLAISCILVATDCIGMNWLYSGLEQYEYITKRSIVFKFLSLILVFIFVREKQDYIIYAAITAFSTLGSYICNFCNARRFISFRISKNLDLKRHFKPMLFLFASILAVSIYTNLDTIMLGLISGDRQVGLYTVAVKVKGLLLTTVNAISAVLLPRLSYYVKENNFDGYNRILKKSTSIIFMLAMPLTAFFIINAKESILLLGGQSYLDAVICMQIIMPILLISGLSNITGNQVLIPLGKDVCFMIAVVTGSIVNFILNCIFMTKFGSVGAAIATLLAEMSQAGIQCIFARKYIIHNIKVKTLAKIIIATAIASFAVVFIKMNFSSNVFMTLAVTSMLFFSIYVVVLNILKEPLIYEYKRALSSKVASSVYAKQGR